MPIAPPKICGHGGCGNLVYDGSARCADHKAKHTKNIRYNKRWERYAKRFRQNNPLCVHCKAEGRITPAECVDHIIPCESQDDGLFWAKTNHQSLCWSCHAKKTARDNRSL